MIIIIYKRKKISVFQHTTNKNIQLSRTISVFHSSKFVLLKLPLITENRINYLGKYLNMRNVRNLGPIFTFLPFTTFTQHRTTVNYKRRKGGGQPFFWH